jgi:hypothetical protein
MRKHLYLSIENVGLNTSQRATLVDALKALGPSSDPQPARLNHWRTRLDNQAAIFEAAFNESVLTINAFKARLAAIFGVDPATIDHVTVNRSFADGTTPVATFSRAGTNYLRFALFGGISATWQKSGDECRGYLALYRDEWEPELPT